MKQFRLRETLAPVVGDYDFVLMDCPPALNILTVNGLVARAVMIPMQVQITRWRFVDVGDAEGARRNLNPALNQKGYCAPCSTTFDGDPAGFRRTRPGTSAIKVYRTIIPRNVRLAEAPSYGKPVIAFDCHRKGAGLRCTLAQELLDRRGGSFVLPPNKGYKNETEGRPRPRHAGRKSSGRAAADPARRQLAASGQMHQPRAPWTTPRWSTALDTGAGTVTAILVRPVGGATGVAERAPLALAAQMARMMMCRP